MPTYIFLSPDGYTFSPSATSATPDIDNLQVLGLASGQNERKALLALYRENPYLEGKGYERIIAVEVKGDWVYL